MENRLVTIMFLDMQGYTRRSAQQNIEELKLFHDEMKAFVSQNLAKYQGVLVKSLGDGFLAWFDSPSQAIQAGLEMQNKLESRNANVLNPEHLIRFRIGINTGEVGIDENGDLFGDPVNIASRIQTFAEPNDVYISESTFMAMNRNQFGAMDLGPQNLKNATREIRVFKILKQGSPGVTLPAGAPKPEAKASASPGTPGRNNLLVGILVGFLVAGTIWGLGRLVSRGRKKPVSTETQVKASPPPQGIPGKRPSPADSSPDRISGQRQGFQASGPVHFQPNRFAKRPFRNDGGSGFQRPNPQSAPSEAMLGLMMDPLRFSLDDPGLNLGAGPRKMLETVRGLYQKGDIGKALDLVSRQLSRVRERKNPGVLISFLLMQAELNMIKGDREAAARALEEVETTLPPEFARRQEVLQRLQQLSKGIQGDQRSQRDDAAGD